MDNEIIDHLQSRLKDALSQNKELEQRLADAVRAKNTSRDEAPKLKKLEKENQQLKEQLVSAGKFVQPDYEAIRSSTLTKLKMGRQSTQGKAIDAFIKELRHVETAKSDRQTVTTIGED